MLIFCFIIATYGLSNLLVYGYGPFDIIERFRLIVNRISRPIGKMFECMMCTSANIGWIVSLLDIFVFTTINFTPFNILINNDMLWYLIIPMDLCFTSGIVWLINTVQNYIESKT